VGPYVRQVRPTNTNTPSEVWDEARVRAEYDIPAAWMAAWVLALAGDASDGVKGVPGVGNKTAMKILKRCDYDWADVLVDPKVAAHTEAAWRNLSLVSLLTDLPGLWVDPMPDWEPTGPSSVLFPDLLALLNRLQLESVRRRLYEGVLWRDGQLLVDVLRDHYQQPL
jgi:5'-3' exonuclease